MSNTTIPLPWVAAGATRACAAWGCSFFGERAALLFSCSATEWCIWTSSAFLGRAGAITGSHPVLEPGFLQLQLNPETFSLEKVQSSHSLHPDATLGRLANCWLVNCYTFLILTGNLLLQSCQSWKMLVKLHSHWDHIHVKYVKLKSFGIGVGVGCGKWILLWLLKSDVFGNWVNRGSRRKKKSLKNKKSHPLGSHGGWEVTSCQKLSPPRQNKPGMCEILCMQLNINRSKKGREIQSSFFQPRRKCKVQYLISWLTKVFTRSLAHHFLWNLLWTCFAGV